jgi:Asp-tRNA(Asn)/Glu-tRNA(Gln) amidotransferase A subunit family amidase
MIVMLLLSETRGHVEMFGASITAKTMARGAPQIFVDGDLNSPHGNNSNRLAPPTGFPAITVPMGFVHGTLPAGPQILGRPGSEPTLIKMGYAYERCGLHTRAVTNS